jgi:hypothetical protein
MLAVLRQSSRLEDVSAHCLPDRFIVSSLPAKVGDPIETAIQFVDRRVEAAERFEVARVDAAVGNQANDGS